MGQIEKVFNRLREELENTAEWNKMITVKRDDLELLLGAYVGLKFELAERSKDDWCGREDD